ncbi:MAG: hypothetical protein P8I61_02580, partial [Opitutae bacterium]|nr:hypothetical protein [Opitutae bacterium]
FKEDYKTIQKWVVTIGTEAFIDNQTQGIPEYFLADGTEVWASEFTAIRNPQTGKEALYGLGSENIYKIEAPDGIKPIITKSKRLRSFP